MTHLLVTNDYPPKIGGIQSYLFELWRRIPPGRFCVYTSAFVGAERFDHEAPHAVIRARRRMLLPTPGLARSIRRLAKERAASVVVLDPIFPLGLVAFALRMPYVLVLHGAEVTIPGRIPGLRRVLAHLISGAEAIIAAGEYPARQARRITKGRLPKTVIIPPGVDTDRFSPPSPSERRAARARLGVSDDTRLVLSVSRLVPRKGMDVLIEAAARLSSTHEDLRVIIAGTGRDQQRLERLCHRLGAPVEFVGAVSEDDLPELYGAADLFVMFARDRWLGLEQEGFGIVYLEAAATGICSIAGRSGGTIDAVIDHRTGLVVDRPADVVVATAALATLLDDEDLRNRFATAARDRALAAFNYDALGATLDAALLDLEAQRF